MEFYTWSDAYPDTCRGLADYSEWAIGSWLFSSILRFLDGIKPEALNVQTDSLLAGLPR